MAQRLMVARAIMHDPDVLFLDEPTSGLDPQSRLALWDVIGELHQRGQTIVLTTHYMEEADQLCERVAIIDHGRLLALDTPAALKKSIGADTEVRLHAAGDLDALAVELAEHGGRRLGARRRRHRLRLPAGRAAPRCPRSSPTPTTRASRCRTSASRKRRSRRSSSISPEGNSVNSATATAVHSNGVKSPRTSSRRAFGALLLRDLAVLRKEIWMFLGRTVMQPLLLDLRVRVRVPEDRPGHRRRPGRGGVLHAARRRRHRELDDLPGRAVGCAAARPGLRLHPRDRRPRARADAGVGGRVGEGRVGCDPGDHRRARGVRPRHVRPGHAGAPQRPLALPDHAVAARRR